MNNLKEYIIEKLNLDSQKISNDSLKKFMNALGIKKSDEHVLRLKHYCDTDCNKYLEKDNYIPEDQWCCTEFDALLMLAVMLLEDGNKAKDILNIGFTSYEGANNPYDFSWFDEENDKDETVLELIQNAYKKNRDFKELWEDFFETVECVCKNTKIDVDTVWTWWEKYY